MRKVLLIALTLHTAGFLHLEGQTSLPYSTSAVQGSTIITNYYDPNAGPDVGPGLPPTPLDSRFNGPLNQFGNQTSAILPTGTYAPTSFATPLVQTTVPQLPAQYPVQQVLPAQTGPVILNPIPTNLNAPILPAQVEEPTYPFPGLLTKMVGRWIASEYLYNLPSDIGILVEVIKPANKPITIDTQILRNEATTLFLKSHFNPESLSIGDDPPLPFFHILVFAYPDDNKTSASISGRFFEKVKLGRLDFDLPGTYQAITWEKSDLIITSSVQFHNQLEESVREIVSAFLKEVNYFDEQKVKQESGFKLEATRDRRPHKIPPPFDNRTRCPW